MVEDRRSYFDDRQWMVEGRTLMIESRWWNFEYR